MDLKRIPFFIALLLLSLSHPLKAQQGWESGFQMMGDFYFATNAYGTASQYYHQQEYFPNLTPFHTEARFYTLSSALRLNTAGAEKMLTAFMLDNPTNYLSETAFFDAANFYFNQGRYSYALKWYSKLSENEIAKAQRPRFNFNKGYAYFSTKLYKNAKPLFEKVKENEVYQSDANYYLGYIAYQLEDFQEANRNFEKLTRREDDNTVGYFQADMNFKLGRFEEAIALARKSLKGADKKETSELSKIIGESYFNLKDYRSAMPYLLAYEGKKGKWNNTDFYQLGYSHYRMKEYERAIEQFSKIISTTDAVAQNAYYHLADSYLKTDQKTAALNAFKRASEMEFNTTIQEDALLNYARLSYEIGNSYERPSVVIQRFISAYPKHEAIKELETLLLDSYVSSKNYAAALVLLEKLPGKIYDEARQKVYYMKAIALYKRGQFQEAFQDFEQVIKLDKNPTLALSARYWKAQSLYELKQYDSAITEFQALKTHPRINSLNEKDWIDYNLGYSFFKTKNYPLAIAAFEQFLNTNPDLAYERDTRLRIGDCHFVLKAYWPAMDQYEKVSQLQPQKAEYAQYQQAISYGFVGRNTQKMDLLQTIIEQFPSSSLIDDVLFELAQSYAKEEKTVEAISIYDQIIKEQPKSPYRSRAFLNKGLLLYNNEQIDEALVILKGLIKRYPNAAVTPQALQTVKEMAIEQNEVGELTAWLKELNLTNLPDLKLERASFEAIERLLADGKKNALRKALENYLEAYPNGKNILKASFLLAELHFEKSDFADAILHYQKILDNPFNTYTEQALVRTTQSLLELGEKEQANLVFLRLEEEAQFEENKRYALANIMKYAFQEKKDYEKTMEYAEKILAQLESEESITWEAYYNLAKSAQALKNQPKAAKAFKALENAPQGEWAVEALYFDALTQHNNKAFAASNKVIEKIAQNYGGYPDFAGKSLLLMSKNFYQLDDAFQATFILESILENFTQFPVLIEEAKKDLANIKAVEAKNNSSVNVETTSNE